MRVSLRLLVASVPLVPLLAVAPAAAKSPKPGQVLTAKDAELARPATIVTKTLGPDQGCQTLLDTGDGDCGVVHAAGGDLIFTVEGFPQEDPALVERPWAIRVYSKSPTIPDGWDLVLENPDREQRTLANASAEVADLTGDGFDEIVFGYRAAGTGEILDYEIVEGGPNGPKVGAHDKLYKGTAVVKRGQVVEYTAVYKRTDGNCCPTWVDRNLVKYRDGKFRIVGIRRTPTKRAHVPPGNLG